MSYQTLIYSVEKGVAEIILNRPEEANTLTPQLVFDLSDVVGKIEQDTSVRAVLLSATEGPFFCAGGDLAHFAKAGEKLPEMAEEMFDTFNPMMEKLFSLDVPLITAVDGAVAGIGCSFVLGSSISLFSSQATFTLAYTGAGLTPDGGASYFLPRVVGLRAGEELILTNRSLDAEESFEWGIANMVVEPDQLMELARGYAKQMAKGPTRAFGNVRKLMLSSLSNDFSSQLAAEKKSFVEMCGTQDCQEGIHAFLEKRMPAFKGN